MSHLLRYIAFTLKLSRSSALLAFVCQDLHFWTEPGKKVNRFKVETFEKAIGTPNTPQYQYNPPNSIAALMNWEGATESD